MIIEKIKELEETEAKAVTLKKEINEMVAAKLTSMHTEVGMDSTDALIAALSSLPKKRKRRVKRAVKPLRKSKRARLTPAQKQSIADVIKGGMTGTEASKKFGISLATIQNIKKEHGLVKSRAKASS